MRPITSMHNTVSAFAIADRIPDNFRRVTVTHAVYADTSDAEAANAERAPFNACMVTMRLADGGFITVWPNGIVQVSDHTGEMSVNYQADTLMCSLTKADVQPKDDGHDR